MNSELKRLKVFQIMPEFSIGGAETMAEQLCYSLKKKGCDITALSLFDCKTEITKRLENNLIDIIYMDKKPGIDITMFFKLYKLFRRERPDVVHSHRNAAMYAIIAGLLAKVPVKVHTLHSIASKENTKPARILNRILFKFKSVIPVSLSSTIQETVIKEYGIKKEDTPIVFNGMPLERYTPKQDYSFKDTINILHIGRITHVKNHEALIKAFAILKKDFPNLHLTLAGDGDLRQEIEDLVKTHSLSPFVEFKGFVSDLTEVLGNADIFCLPSHYEGISLSIIEAMATGLPIVATNVGGTPDMINHEVNGLLCETFPESIAEQIKRLLVSQDLREKLGKEALKNSLRFSSDQMGDNYLRIYNRALRGDNYERFAS